MSSTMVAQNKSNNNQTTTTSYFFVENFGCQMNRADTSEMIHLLLLDGFKESNRFDENCNIVMLNSCAIRKTSEQRVYGRLAHYAGFKRKRKNFILILSGCVAQKDKEKVVETIPEVDLVVGTHDKFRINTLIANCLQEKGLPIPKKISSTCDVPFSPGMLQKNNPFSLPSVSHKKTSNTAINTNKQDGCTPKIFSNLGQYQFTQAIPTKKHPFKADVIIIHGCIKFCSYCIVPYTRGGEMSRPSQDIVENTKQLVQQGVTEICLLGQNVNSYGQDNADISFSRLLERLNKIDGLRRIRFLTSHPMDFSFDLIDAIANSEKVCNYIHLPIQSASDFVLKKMRRDYTFARYMQIVEQLRKKIPELVFSTDILLGFPFESHNDFQKTLQAVIDIRYDSAFIFKYSIREGAEASNYPPEQEIPEQEKIERVMLVNEVQQKITKECNLNDVGKIMSVLLEGPSKKNPKELIGKTETNKSVLFQTSPENIGKYVNLHLTELRGNTFIGQIP